MDKDCDESDCKSMCVEAKDNKSVRADHKHHSHSHHHGSSHKGNDARGNGDSESDGGSDESHSDEDEDNSDRHVNLSEIHSRLGPESSRHRRSVVSSFVPVDKSWMPPVYPKSAHDESSIRRSVQRNLLFSNVSEDTHKVLANAMQYVAVKKGEEIIQQGETGDLFYILDSGMCHVVINGRVVGEIDGTSDRNFFGELALLYDAPRAATIVAVTDVECWSLDRITFKRVLMATTIKQRQLYLDFIDQVPIFATLSGYERMIVADALRVCYYERDSVVIEEGTDGDDFFIIEDGEVMCTKDGKEVSSRLGSGDFFGELSLVTDHHRMATVTAVRRTKCLMLDRKTFKRLLGPMQEHLRKRADLYELYMNAPSAVSVH